MTSVEEPRGAHRQSHETRFIRRTMVFIGVLLWIAVIAAGAGKWMSWRAAQQETTDKTELPPGTLPAKPRFHEYDLPEFSLTECRGRTVTRSDLLGRPAVICFVFTRCMGQCRLVDAQMRQMQELISETDARLVTITVDPAHDTAERLKTHARTLNADPNRWWFLTGKEDAVYRLIQQGFRLSVQQNTGADRKKGDEVSHSDAVLYVNKSGRIVGKYSGSIPAEMAQLRLRIQRDFRAARTPADDEGARRGG